jgi:hypothetical protein
MKVIVLAETKLGFWKLKNNSTQRKYKESALMAFLTNPIGQPSLNISSILSNEVSNSQGGSV